MSRNIPKTIHYCWFGGKEKPASVINYIETWRKFNPEYDIVEWNENNFDLDLYKYSREAYDEKRFAFVTDVVRLYALKNHGGIYMDTDVEVIGSFDQFLEHEAFTGCETSEMCVTGTMASIKNGEWVSNLLSYYDNRRFLKNDGSVDLTTNTTAITSITKDKYGWEESDTYQDLGSVTIYPSDVFCAKSYHTGNINKTQDTVTIHHFNGSWKSNSEKLKSKTLTKVKNVIISVFGEEVFGKLNSIRGK